MSRLPIIDQTAATSSYVARPATGGGFDIFLVYGGEEFWISFADSPLERDRYLADLNQEQPQ
jgi:hypothetical protein